MAKAVTLTTLPNELLDAICARLNRSARCALALACKATNSSAIAALYQTYTNRSHPSEAPFYLFLRTICENPKHAALVKVVDIRGWRSELEVATNSAWRPMVTPPEEEDEAPVRSGPLFTSTDRPVGACKDATPASSAALFQLFLDTSVKIGLVAMPASIDHIPALKANAQMGTTLKQDADFIRQLKHGVEDAYFILMVAQLSQLEKLLIDGLTPYPILDWHHFFSRPSGCLQSLKILNLWASHIAKEERVVKTTLQILDILPNLEHLQLQGLSAQGHRHTADDSLPSKKLHIVVLYDCAVRHRLLKKIADGQNIRTFLYTMGKRQLSGNRGAIFSAEQIAGHLESSKHSLRGLTLCPLLQSAHPRLHEFDGLRYLSMSYPMLLPGLENNEDPEIIQDHLQKRLPVSLRQLCLDPVVNFAYELQVAKATATLKLNGGLPHLRRVILRFAEVKYNMGPSSLTLDHLKARITTDIWDSFKAAKLKLKVDHTEM